ncbi:MAG: thioredoxin-dependent thiol peroxidase [Acidobacteriota bacterium]
MKHLKPGDPAPEFEAQTDSGEKIRLRDLRGKAVVLYFYPKDDTPGCTQQACGFRDRYADFEKAGVVVFGVSPDDAESHRKFRRKHALPFPLLVDSDHRLAETYGAWGEKSMYGKKYWGVVRSHFVIGPDGVLRDVQYNVKPGQSPAKAWEAILS